MTVSQLDVREVILREWDPIGVQSISEAQSEYDAYVPGICQMVRDGKSVSEIEHYLNWLETEQLGVPGDYARRKAVAERLVNLRVQPK